ncbi:hypothetical protein [Ramlibacter sp. 2FC]|uniref:hypothetical protein n=1 Tax=Ramlibacter sp. 2FC TaxID=2502188 RepID=UPI001485528F|nr:hypothetical protein [Ramlibacter sp. 2FC]
MRPSNVETIGVSGQLWVIEVAMHEEDSHDSRSAKKCVITASEPIHTIGARVNITR